MGKRYICATTICVIPINAKSYAFCLALPIWCLDLLCIKPPQFTRNTNPPKGAENSNGGLTSSNSYPKKIYPRRWGKHQCCLYHTTPTNMKVKNLLDWNHYNKHYPNKNTYDLFTHIHLQNKLNMKICMKIKSERSENLRPKRSESQNKEFLDCTPLIRVDDLCQGTKIYTTLWMPRPRGSARMWQ